jgi:hypothetical protein
VLRIVGIIWITATASTLAQPRPDAPALPAQPLDAQLMHKLMTCSAVLDRHGWILLPDSQFDFTLFTGRADRAAREANDMALAAHVPAEEINAAWDRYHARAGALDEAAIGALVQSCRSDPSISNVVAF